MLSWWRQRARRGRGKVMVGMGVMNADEPVERVFMALCEGRLTRDDLTARKIAAFLGQTTMVLYHHFGSLDGFLIRVDGLGWRRLAERLDARARGWRRRAVARRRLRRVRACAIRTCTG